MKTTNKRSTFFGFAVTAMMLAASMVMGCKQPSVTVTAYPVSFSAVGGTVTASVDGKAIKNGDLIGVGKEVTFTAHPQSGMQVARWTGIDKSEGKVTITLTVKAGVSVTAECTAIMHTVTFAQPEHGKLTASIDGKAFTGGAVQKGKTVVFTAVPADGYRVKKWTGTDNPASTDKTAVLTVKENATVSVEFEAIGQLFNVTFDTPQNGTLNASLDGSPFTGGEVQEGKIIVFTAEPAPTYRVRNWTGLENADTKTILTLTVTKAVHVSVAFINVPEYRITFSQPEHGSLTAMLDGVPFDGTQKAAEGKHIVFTAIPEIGYRLLKWENVNTDPEHGYVKVHTVQADKTVSVTFEEDTILTIRKSWGKYYVESCKTTAEGKIEVPDYVKRIASNAFKDCVKVTEVTLPAGVTKIGRVAFRGCTGLTSITLPAGVTEIENTAFEGCTGLTSISLPAGLTQIGSEAFSRCTRLKDITIEAVNITEIGSSAFYNIHAGSKFKVKSGSNVKQKLINYGIAESKIEEV